jgi:hypothetical protein
VGIGVLFGAQALNPKNTINKSVTNKNPNGFFFMSILLVKANRKIPYISLLDPINKTESKVWFGFLYIQLPIGLRYWRWGGRGQCLGTGKA